MNDLIMNFQDAIDILNDIGGRNKNKKWKEMNYTDKYNLAISTKIIRQYLKDMAKELDCYADMPIEFLEEERMKEREEKNKYFTKK